MKEAIDTKAIEEKTLNHFKSFIEDSGDILFIAPLNYVIVYELWMKQRYVLTMT